MNMQNLTRLLFALTFLCAPLFAHGSDDKPAHKVTYVANMAGIECAACKKTIARSIGKIKGVKTIRIVKLTEKSHRLFVETDGTNPISISQVKKTLGKNVDHYKITSWSKK